MKEHPSLVTKAERERRREDGRQGAYVEMTDLLRIFGEQPVQLRAIPKEALSPSSELFFGLDGDNTGIVLENLFLGAREESSLTGLSRAVTAAIKHLENRIALRCGPESIVFAAGDDILFKGRCDTQFLVELQQAYRAATGGLTCSVGFGGSLREVYLALKLAKSSPGKNAIQGVELF